MAVTDEPAVFVSYSHHDIAAVETLDGALVDAGIQVWRDVGKIAVGDYFRGNIAKAIASSDAVVLALSDQSAKSSEVLGELELAREEKTPILPILIEPLENALPSRLRQILAGIHHVELYKDFDRGMAATVAAIRGHSGTRARFDSLPSDFPALEGLGRAKVNRLATECEQRLTAGRYDVRTLLLLGRYYLFLGRYREARDRLRTAVRTDPTSASAAYLLALSAVAGRRPAAMTMREAEGISQLLERAASLDPGSGHYDYLAAVVKADYYESNGLLVPSPSVDELTERLSNKHLDGGEVARIDNTVQIESEVRARALGHDR
jgi:tetratricopeptide (TPR) repeat protein